MSVQSSAKESALLKDSDMIRRNSVVFYAMAVIGSITILSVLTLGEGLELSSILTVLLQLVILGAIGYLHFTRRLTHYIMYIAIGGVAITVLIHDSTNNLASVSEQSTATLQQMSATLQNLLDNNLSSSTHIKEVEENLKNIIN